MITPELLKEEIYEINHEWKKIYYAPLTRDFDIRLEWEWNLDIDWYNKAIDISEVPDFIKEKSFSSLLSKIKIRLNVTSKCNLNCSYCSVNANSRQWINMTDEMAYNSIDNLFDYAIKNNATEIELTFSWWEPTIKSDLIEKIVKYTDEKVKWTNIKLITKLLTNWVLPKNKIPLLCSLFNWIQISWDWFLENNPRFWNKHFLHNIIWENIWEFVKNWARVNILTVVSEDNYKDLEKIVDELYNNFWIWDIVLSLKDSVWRWEWEIKIDYENLRKIYMDLWKKYRWFNIDIPLTWTDIHSLSNHPCWISVPNFSIWPKGDISSCTLDFNYTDKSEENEYNIWQMVWDEMILKEQKITKLQAIDVISMNDCSDCYAKWHCRWWCRYANKWEWLWDLNPERCEMIRKILADKILFLAWV